MFEDMFENLTMDQKAGLMAIGILVVMFAIAYCIAGAVKGDFSLVGVLK